jgi:uncharacterized protein (TIGR00288 family)
VTGPNSRSGRQAASATSAPHAALLIDFDNVTLGIRSDLTKELKTLLASEIIRGKVAVQRAYADWRRYSQYVMPLTERSIDLIFATAVGSTKKNATDIRLAIDAVELVFTRPEIGTFILLSGDSDFSSLVIKLKEYGKYVIGVGIRESAGDLLIQNCDEYYSYNELAGLTKEEEPSSVQRDPWDLVAEAVARMSRQNDVMRSDRLKQVMQEIDPNFDERNAGFNRFSKFVTEAANRKLLKVTKLDNGQFEVGPLDQAGRIEPTPIPARAVDEENGNRGRGRGRRGPDRQRGERVKRDPERPADRPAERAHAERAHAERAPTERAPADRAPTDRAPAGGPRPLTLGAAFTLLTRALGELGDSVPHERLRARMSALHGREDPLLEPGRFDRFLRQANDAEVGEVRKVGEDAYEVSLSRAARAQTRHSGPPPERAAAPSPDLIEAPTVEYPVPTPVPASSAPDGTGPASRPAMLRFRRGSRALPRPSEVPLVGVVAAFQPPPAPEPPAPAAPAPKRARSAKGGRPRRTKAAATGAAAPAAAEAPAAASAQPGESKRRGRGPRKGR